MQEKVAENMVMLTKSLKEQSQIASTIIKGDTEVIKNIIFLIFFSFTLYYKYSKAGRWKLKLNSMSSEVEVIFY